MKVSAVVAALLLLTLALSFGLVRLDIVDAGLLRLLPALMALIIAGSVGYVALRSRRRRLKQRGKK
jgi:hypothetical protein